MFILKDTLAYAPKLSIYAHKVIICQYATPSAIYSGPVKSNFNARLARWADSHNSNIRARVARFDSSIPPCNPCNHITGFGCDQHLCWASSRASTEGNKVPHGTQFSPSIRVEFQHIIAPDLGISVKHVLIDLHDIAFADVNWLFPVWTTACWQNCIFETLANLCYAIRVQSVCLLTLAPPLQNIVLTIQ